VIAEPFSALVGGRLGAAGSVVRTSCARATMPEVHAAAGATAMAVVAIETPRKC